MYCPYHANCVFIVLDNCMYVMFENKIITLSNASLRQKNGVKNPRLTWTKIPSSTIKPRQLLTVLVPVFGRVWYLTI